MSKGNIYEVTLSLDVRDYDAGGPAEVCRMTMLITAPSGPDAANGVRYAIECLSRDCIWRKGRPYVLADLKDEGS